jgi:hypothetical protein
MISLAAAAVKRRIDVISEADEPVDTDTADATASIHSAAAGAGVPVLKAVGHSGPTKLVNIWLKPGFLPELEEVTIDSLHNVRSVLQDLIQRDELHSLLGDTRAAQWALYPLWVRDAVGVSLVRDETALGSAVQAQEPLLLTKSMAAQLDCAIDGGFFVIARAPLRLERKCALQDGRRMPHCNLHCYQGALALWLARAFGIAAVPTLFHALLRVVANTCRRYVPR